MDDTRTTTPTAPKAPGRSSSRPTTSARIVTEATATERSVDGSGRTNSGGHGVPSGQEEDHSADAGSAVVVAGGSAAELRADSEAGAVEGGGAVATEPIAAESQEPEGPILASAVDAASTTLVVSDTAPLQEDAFVAGASFDGASGGGAEERDEGAAHSFHILDQFFSQSMRGARQQMQVLYEQLVQPESEFWNTEECTTVHRLVGKSMRDLGWTADAVGHRKELVLGAKRVSRSACRAHRQAFLKARALADASGQHNHIGGGSGGGGSSSMSRLRTEMSSFESSAGAAPTVLQTTGDDIIALYRNAHAIQADFDSRCKAVYATLSEEQQFDVEWGMVALKPLWRSAEKAAFPGNAGNKKGGASSSDVARIVDVVRGSFVCESVDAMVNIVHAMMASSELLTLVRLKDRWNGQPATPSGWSDILINVCLPGEETKHVCEIQVLYRGMLDALAEDDTLTSSYEAYAMTRPAVELLARMRLTESEAYRDDLEKRYEDANRTMVSSDGLGGDNKDYELLASLKDELDDHDELDEQISDLLDQLAEEDAAEDYHACVPLDKQLKELREEQLKLKQQRAEEDRLRAEAEAKAQRDAEVRMATQRLLDAGYKKGDVVYVHTSHVHSAGVVEAGTRGFVEGPGKHHDIESFAGLGGAIGAGIGGELVLVRFSASYNGPVVMLELPACALQKVPLTVVQKAQAAEDQAFRLAERAREAAARVDVDGAVVGNLETANGQQQRQRQRRTGATTLRVSLTPVASVHGGAYRGEIETVEKTILSSKAQDIPHGLGVFEFSDGSDYAGQFWHGQKTGHGVIRGPRQSQHPSSSGESKYVVYAGEMNNGWKQGFGTWWNPDATVNYSGEWKAGMPFPPPQPLQLQQPQGGKKDSDEAEEEQVYAYY